MPRAKKMCDAIISTVKAHPAKNKALVIAGDLLDGKDPTEPERNLALNFIISLVRAKVHVILINGNHDFRDADGLTMLDGFHEIKKLENKYLHVVTATPDTVDVDDLSVSFLCVPCQQNLRTKQLKKILSRLHAKAKHSTCYGVVHEALNGCVTDNNRTLPSDCDAPVVDKLAGIMCGDIHVQQQMSPGVWYAGSPYQTKINESTEKGMLLWTPGKTDPVSVPLTGIPQLIRVTDPKQLKKYENTEHSVKYVGTERVQTQAPNVTVQPNLTLIEGASKIKKVVEETRHSALTGLKLFMLREGLDKSEVKEARKIVLKELG